MNTKYLSLVEISTIEACGVGAEHHILAEPPQRGPMRDIVSAFAHAGSRPRILDVGCGYGRLVPHLRELGQFTYVGIDPAERMIQLAREEHPGMDFREMNLYELPEQFPEGHFDLVLVPLTLSYVPHGKASRALAALRKVTRKVAYFALMNDHETFCITPNLLPCAQNYPDPKSTLFGYPFASAKSMLHQARFAVTEVYDLGCNYYATIAMTF